jgi:hypothetical protein
LKYIKFFLIIRRKAVALGPRFAHLLLNSSEPDAVDCDEDDGNEPKADNHIESGLDCRNCLWRNRSDT